MKLLYLLEGMVAYVRGAVRRGWRWWWDSGTEYPFIPDPLRVLPEAPWALPGAVYFLPDPADLAVDPFDFESLGPEWVEMGYVVDKDGPDPVKRAYDLVAETNRVLTEVFGGAWDLPPDPLGSGAADAKAQSFAQAPFDPTDWYPLDGENWEALIAKAEDPYLWTPEIDWDDVIIRGDQ